MRAGCPAAARRSIRASEASRLTARESAGSASERLLGTEARWKTTSGWAASARSSTAGSPRSPTIGSAPAGISGRVRSQRISLPPREAARRRARALPMKPPAPVIRTVLMAPPRLAPFCLGATPDLRRSAQAADGLPAQPSPSSNLPSIRMKAIRHGLSERLAQPWLVPRWMTMSPGRHTVSPWSTISTSSPSRTMA